MVRSSLSLFPPLPVPHLHVRRCRHRHHAHRRRRHRIKHRPARVRHAVHVRRRRWYNLRLELERELEEKLLRVFVPVRPELALRFLHLAGRHLERDRFVRFGGKQQVLPLAIWRLYLLLVRRHEPVPRHDAVRYFRIVDLEQQRLLAVLRIALLRHPVAGPTNFHELFRLNARLLRLNDPRCFLRLLGRTACQIGLMLFALRVGQVAALVVVQRQAELTLVRAEMVFHKVRILVQVDRFKGELAEPLAPIPVAFGPGGDTAAAGFATGSVLEIHRTGKGGRKLRYFAVHWKV